MSAGSASFHELDPDLILEATESAGFRCTGELTQMNSYENRVFEVGVESDLPRQRQIIKFYRPGRWSREALVEEHTFLQELKDADIPVAPALRLPNGTTLGSIAGMNWALFPRVSGRLPDELNSDQLASLGRLLARLHNVGARESFHHRPILHQKPHNLWENLDLLENHVSVELWPRYESAAITLIDAYEEQVADASFQRIHGDFHRGNTLFTDGQFQLVDFDDCCMGPVVQDLWMLFSSDQWEREADTLLRGYEEFRAFPREQLNLIPTLRGCRILSYAAWIARRWSDPSFPRLFPDFGSHRYWSVETEALEKIIFSEDFG